MAYFAEINKNYVVIRVLSVPDEQEHRGQDFLANDLGLGGQWIQTSYNNRIRKQYASVNYTYDPIADVFVKPCPYPSWKLDENHDWQPPTQAPTNSGEYLWDETLQEWVTP